MDLQAESRLGLVTGRSLPETSTECHPRHPSVKVNSFIMCISQQDSAFCSLSIVPRALSCPPARQGEQPFRVIKRELVPINPGQCRGWALSWKILRHWHSYNKINYCSVGLDWQKPWALWQWHVKIQLNVDVVRHTETGLLLYVGSDIYCKEKKIRLVLGMES